MKADYIHWRIIHILSNGYKEGALKIGKYCTRNAITADKDSSIVEAAKLMRQHHVGSLVIISRDSDGDKPVGMLTDRDIVLEVLAEEVAVDSVTIDDVMTRKPVTAWEHDDMFATMETMRLKGIRRVPVTDSSGVLVGILTSDDLLGIFYEEMGHMVALISNEQLRELSKRSG